MNNQELFDLVKKLKGLNQTNEQIKTELTSSGSNTNDIEQTLIRFDSNIPKTSVKLNNYISLWTKIRKRLLLIILLIVFVLVIILKIDGNIPEKGLNILQKSIRNIAQLLSTDAYIFKENNSLAFKDSLFYLKYQKDKYLKFESVNVSIVSKESISESSAKDILGENITFVLTRPDGTIVEQKVLFPIIKGFTLDCPDCKQPGDFEGSVDCWFTRRALNQIGDYKISVIPNGIVPEFNFEVGSSKADDLFMDDLVGNYILKERHQNERSEKNIDNYKAIYVNSGKELSVDITFITPSYSIENYANDELGTEWGESKEIIKELGQNIYFMKYKKSTSFIYLWTSDNKIIVIGGYNAGEDEKFLLDEYLKKYPSSQ